MTVVNKAINSIIVVVVFFMIIG
ncbi:MAG: hypothetical protein EOM61_08270 [Bacteroidia bacterium]|nr:hypothetical protein [Bacteroidia bacterium]